MFLRPKRYCTGALLLLCLASSRPAEAGIFGKSADPQPFNLDSLVASRDPELLMSSVDDDLRDKVKDRFHQILIRDTEIATERNSKPGMYYPNPSLQAYVNRLGLSLIPRSASDKIFLNFRIISSPAPSADALATGTVYLSSGLISLLENESQLAFVLMHEAAHVVLSHHLHEIVEEEIGAKRAKRYALVGAVVGGLLGAATGGKGRVEGGMALGAAAVLQAEANWKNRVFPLTIETEADRFAAEVLLANGFDAREAPRVMAKVGDIVRRSGAAVDLAFGNSQDLPPRSTRVTEVLAGELQPVVARVLDGDGFRLSSPRYNQLMSELKRDNGLLALERDLFAITRSNLEEAAAVRTDDPLTTYGLGMLYRTVGRTDEDRAKAASLLKAAMEFDAVRHRFPEAHLQYAVELLSREDPQFYPEIQQSLKNYVVLYQRKSGGKLPPEMKFVYDYLDLTGDRSWIAYDVDNVSSEAPYQLTGVPGIDQAAPTAEPVTTGPR